MSSILDEIRSIQNPALGSVLLWKFNQGFNETSAEEATILHNFLVLPMVFHPYSYGVLQSTQEGPGLPSIANKLANPAGRFKSITLGGVTIEHGAENLFALSDRVKSYREITFKSLLIGIEARLLDLDVSVARITALDVDDPKKLPEEITKMLKASRKFGAMCGKLTLSQISHFLKVRF